MAQVERQGKVGDGLNKLKYAREDIDECLRQTREFNQRIEDPETWNKILRKRQRDEMKAMQVMRDNKRLQLILKMDAEPENEENDELRKKVRGRLN